MELKELRIGNWFLGYDNKPFQWDLECFSYLMETDIKWAVELDEIIKEPIPLTEQWLLDFGFVKKITTFYDYHVTFFEQTSTNGTIQKSKFSLGRNGTEVFLNNVWICGIQYVHQLQNLYYSLTGQELIKK